MSPELAQLVFGRGEAPPRPVLLRAGPLTAAWGNGDLRYVRFGGQELVRRVYFALRDDQWATVPLEIGDVRLREDGDRFDLAFRARNARPPHAMDWRGSIEGTAAGEIRFAIEGTARAAFVANRVGFCLLHPAEAAGAPVQVRHVDGSVQDAYFPDRIAPFQPFCDIRAVRHRPAEGVWCDVAFEGDAFEMEDQRNWSDASFKTYCTPLHRSVGSAFEPGQTVRQVITIRLETRVLPPPRDEVVRTGEAVEAGAAARIGLVHRPGFRAGPERLRRSGIAFLRVAIARSPDLENLAVAARLAARSGIPLELELSHRMQDASAAVADAVGAAVVRGIAVTSRGMTTDPEDFLAARARFGRGFPGVRWGAGSRGNFTELNREPPSSRSLDYVGYPVCAQVHAFDDADILETSATHGEQARCARRLFPAQAVAVGPISVGPPDDPRRGTLLEAAWTLASMAELSAAGAVTACYDTDLESVTGPTPLALALEALGGPPARKVTTGDRLRVASFDAPGDPGERWLVNLSPEDTEVEVPGYRLASVLDGASLVRGRAFAPSKGRGNRAVLSPYAIARFVVESR